MNSAYVLSHVNNLQRELLQISEHYREYFTKKDHSADERAQHEEQVERVNKIREELLAVVEKRQHSRRASHVGP